MEHNNFDISAVVQTLGLKPTSSRKDELRFRTKGSLSVNTAIGTFFDHEQHNGGGMLDLVIYKGEANSKQEAAEWLKQRGLIADDKPAPKSKNILRDHPYRDAMGEPVGRAVKYEDRTHGANSNGKRVIGFPALREWLIFPIGFQSY